MAELTTSTLCPVHPEQVAIALCDRCGKALCLTCRVQAVADEQVFCSSDCRNRQHSDRARPTASTSDELLLRGYERPYSTGWRLWRRSLLDVVGYTLPVCLAMIPVLAFDGGSMLDKANPPSALASMSLTLIVAFGMALTGVVLTRNHTGFAPGNLYLWTLKRLIHWGATGLLVGLVAIFGFLALIIPGILLSLRLFWADEFALVHRVGPVEALRESWRLTRGKAGMIFGFQFVLSFASYLIIFPLMIVVGLAVIGLQRLFGTTLVTELSQMLVFALAFFVGYAGIHAPELAYFYGLRTRGEVASARSELADA